MALTVEQAAQAESDRYTRISAESIREDVAYVEIIYRDRWVRFDISTMQAAHLTPQQLVARCFVQPLEAVGLVTQLAESSAGASSSETP